VAKKSNTDRAAVKSLTTLALLRNGLVPLTLGILRPEE